MEKNYAYVIKFYNLELRHKAVLFVHTVLALEYGPRNFCKFLKFDHSKCLAILAIFQKQHLSQAVMN